MVKRRLGGIQLVALGNLAGPVFALATGPVLARALGPDGRGVLAVSMTALVFAPLLFSIGIPAALVYFGARGLLSWQLYRRLLVVALALGGAGSVLTLAYMAALGQTYDTLLVVAVALPVVLVLDCLRGLLQADRRFGAIAQEAWLGAGIRFCAIIVLAWLDALTPVTGTCIVVLVSMAQTAPWIGKARHLLAAGAVATAVVAPGALARYAGATWLGQFASLSNTRIDQAVLAFFTSSKEIGLYAVAVTWTELPVFLVGAAQRVALTRGGTDWGDAMAARTTRLAIASGTVLAAVLALGAPFILPLLFGREFEGAVRLSYVLLPGVLVGFGGAMFGSLLAARGRPGSRSLGELVGLLVTAAGLVTVVPTYGAIGAAATSSVCYTAIAVVCWYFLRRTGFREPIVLVTLEDLRWLKEYLSGARRTVATTDD